MSSQINVLFMDATKILLKDKYYQKKWNIVHLN